MRCEIVRKLEEERDMWGLADDRAKGNASAPRMRNPNFKASNDQQIAAAGKGLADAEAAIEAHRRECPECANQPPR